MGAVGLPNGTLVVKVGSNDYVFRVRVVINGESQRVPEGVTIAALVAQLGLNQRRIAVEVNREILPREQYLQHTLAEGDQIEIVHFVGGG
jgi:sulfur carrier protein